MLRLQQSGKLETNFKFIKKSITFYGFPLKNVAFHVQQMKIHASKHYISEIGTQFAVENVSTLTFFVFIIIH